MSREQPREMIMEELIESTPLNKAGIDRAIKLWIDDLKSFILTGNVEISDVKVFKGRLEKLWKSLQAGKYK